MRRESEFSRREASKKSEVRVDIVRESSKDSGGASWLPHTQAFFDVSASAEFLSQGLEFLPPTHQVEDFLFATGQLAQTTLRSVVGQAELDELLAERDKLNSQMQTIIDEQTDPWGIKVMTVEVKDVDLPIEMKRAMARQAEAERERRSKVILAEGEFQASQRLSEAATVIEKHPVALQLRYLQALQEVAAEHNSTTVFPLPIDLVRPFLARNGSDANE